LKQVKIIARQSMGYEFIDQGLRLKSLLDEDIIGKMVENRLQKIWGWFISFGTFISGLLGIYVILKTITTALNTWAQYNFIIPNIWLERKIISGIFSSLTHYFMYNSHKKRFNNESKDSSINVPEVKIIEAPKDKKSGFYPETKRVSL